MYGIQIYKEFWKPIISWIDHYNLATDQYKIGFGITSSDQVTHRPIQSIISNKKIGCQTKKDQSANQFSGDCRQLSFGLEQVLHVCVAIMEENYPALVSPFQ